MHYKSVPFVLKEGGGHEILLEWVLNSGYYSAVFMCHHHCTLRKIYMNPETQSLIHLQCFVLSRFVPS